MTKLLPAVAHDSFIAWPNGGGETPCSLEFSTAVDAKEDAERLACQAEDEEAWDEWRNQTALAAEIDARIQVLLAAGHRGEAVTYPTPCPVTAMLGGATMTATGEVWCRELRVGQL